VRWSAIRLILWRRNVHASTLSATTMLRTRSVASRLHRRLRLRLRRALHRLLHHTLALRPWRNLLRLGLPLHRGHLTLVRNRLPFDSLLLHRRRIGRPFLLHSLLRLAAHTRRWLAPLFLLHA
jgi:hypothetical protein